MQNRSFSWLVFQCFVFQSESDSISNRLCDCFVENNGIREWIRREVTLMSSLEVASSSFYVRFFFGDLEIFHHYTCDI